MKGPRTTPTRGGAASLRFEDLGRLDYATALARQRDEHAALVAARGSATARPMTVFLVEHDPPVITITRRPGAAANLLASPAVLASHGVTVAETDRGGDITYHGPGQLVAYPILDLERLGLRIHGYMRLLESVITATLARFGIDAARDETATGVWVDRATDGGRKICAMGVRVSRWATLHGLALNVTTDLTHFGLIVPCGLAGRKVTSLHAELGERCPSMAEVKRMFADVFEAAVRDLPKSSTDYTGRPPCETPIDSSPSSRS